MLLFSNILDCSIELDKETSLVNNEQWGNPHQEFNKYFDSSTDIEETLWSVVLKMNLGM